MNRGKQFEDLVRSSISKLENTLIVRLYDVTTGYLNQNNICDYIVYRQPTIFLIECKAIQVSTLNFKSHIRENQLNGLLESSKIHGVKAGILCWFINYNKTLFIPIEHIQELQEKGYKSFNINNYDSSAVYEIPGNKKRVFFEYDFDSFLERIIDEERSSINTGNK